MARHRWSWRPPDAFFFWERALGGRQPPSHHRTPWGVAPWRPPASCLESPVQGSCSLAPVARNWAQRVRGRLRWVKPYASCVRTNHRFYPIETKVLGDQGTDHQVTGQILPEGKMGASPIGGVRETAQRLPHTQAVRPIERSASVPRANARGVIGLPRCAPGRTGKQHGGAGA